MSQIPLTVKIKHDEKVLKEKLSRSPKEERARLEYLAKKIKEGFIDNIYRVSVFENTYTVERSLRTGPDSSCTFFEGGSHCLYKIFGDEPQKTVKFIKRFNSDVDRRGENLYKSWKSSYFDNDRKNFKFLQEMAYLIRGRCGITPCDFPNINCIDCKLRDSKICPDVKDWVETRDLETKADKKSLEIKFNEFCEKEAKDIMNAAISKVISSFVINVKVENLESAQTQISKASTETIEEIKKRLEQTELAMIEEKYPRRARNVIYGLTPAHKIVLDCINDLCEDIDDITEVIDGYCKKLETLIKDGADMGKTDKLGFTPLDYLKKYPEVYKIVKERVEKAIIEYQTKKLKEQKNKNRAVLEGAKTPNTK